MDYDRSLIEEDIMDDGGIGNHLCYYCWRPGDNTCVLDGAFTADELIAIGCYMKEKSAKTR